MDPRETIYYRSRQSGNKPCGDIVGSWYALSIRLLSIAKTKYLRLDNLKKRDLFSSHIGKLKVQARVAPLTGHLVRA
jgi:hypothetical protein